jgi:RecB family exonuclease
VFAEICAKEKVAPGYRTETLRVRMRSDLERFAEGAGQPAGPGTRIEEPFQFALNESIEVRGRIDRMDCMPDGKADVVDYKYSKRAADYAKDVNRLQGPLYLLAVEQVFHLKPGKMSYCGLRGAVQFVAQEVTGERLTAARETTLRIAAEVREGHAEPRPASLEPCRYCTFKDVCRYEAAAAGLTVAEGG